jgi:DNA-binding NarL/FixJ family response regulator
MADAACGEVEVSRARQPEPKVLAQLQSALEAYTELGMPFRAARVRLAIARGLAAARPTVAVAEARAALAVFEKLNATPSAEVASDLVDSLSGLRPAKTAPRQRTGLEALTSREREVLGLVTAGLSNPEIAATLEITAKTAEHHVCAILSKLDVKTRAAAAALGARRRSEEKAPP